MKPKTDFAQQKLIISPHLKQEINISSVSSLSVNNESLIIITRDYKAKELHQETKFNAENFESSKFELEIKDEKGCVLYPISALIYHRCILFLGSEVKNGYKMKLALFSYANNSRYSLILNIGNSNPVAIYGGYHFAAIDSEGGIIIIPGLIWNDPNKLLESQHLPNGEKAVSIAYGNEFFALSSKGKLFMSKDFENPVLTCKLVKKLEKHKIVQISAYEYSYLFLTEEGRVFAYGSNSYGNLCSKPYNIKGIYIGWSYSLFQTSNGQIIACGSNKGKLCLVDDEVKEYHHPVETIVKKDAVFCVAGDDSIVVFGEDAEMSPNRTINEDLESTRIALFGCKAKTQILHMFINNSVENQATQLKSTDEYCINIEVNKSFTKNIMIFDSSAYDEDRANRIKYYHLAPYFLFFVNGSESDEKVEEMFEEAKEVWNDVTNKIGIVLCSSIFQQTIKKNYNLKSKYQELSNKYKCEIFEINSKNIDEINNPFYFFLSQDISKSVKNSLNVSKKFKQYNMFKLGREHRNPFDDINKKDINIGIFGSESANKTELGFKFVYEDVHKYYYDDHQMNFTDIKLSKFVEVCNEMVSVSVIDSTYVKNIEKTYYSMLQGIIIAFNIDIIYTPQYKNEIMKVYNEIKESAQEDRIYVIALIKMKEEQHQLEIKDRIDILSNELKEEIFIISIEDNENVFDIFYFLIRRIIKKRKQKKVINKNKKKKHSKHIKND